MRSNHRLFHRGLRMLVLAIVLVLVPARATAFDSTVESTPMLVLSAATAEPADAQHRDAARELPTVRILPPRPAMARSPDATVTLIRVFHRYVENCSWLC
jgi:hypothetical protein